MKYITSRELSEKWSISQRRIVRLATEGRIAGAKLYGNSWMFPENAPRPADGRTREGKAEKEKKSDSFRYPIFEYKDPASFAPSLSKDEMTIKAVTEAFNAHRFTEANSLLGSLSEKSENKYIRIAALYCECMLSIFLCDTRRFIDRYGELKAECIDDFPHKAEMCEYLHEIDSVLGEDEYYSNEFHNITAYCYHESFLPRLCNLASLKLAFGNNQIEPADLMSSEIYCSFLEKTDNVFDLQAIHVYLACAYAMADKKTECLYHFRKALRLAEKYEMFYTFSTMQYYYMPNILEEALEGFPAELKNKIADCNHEFRNCHLRFTNALQMNSIYKLLTGDGYIYMVFAVQGLTNKEVANRMHVSVGTVGKRYGELYAFLGVKNKKEMTQLYHSLTDKIVADQPWK